MSTCHERCSGAVRGSVSSSKLGARSLSSNKLGAWSVSSSKLGAAGRNSHHGSRSGRNSSAAAGASSSKYSLSGAAAGASSSKYSLSDAVMDIVQVTRSLIVVSCESNLVHHWALMNLEVNSKMGTYVGGTE